MNILITGGFGYLGGRLVQAILENTEHQVVIASRQLQNAPSWLPAVHTERVQWDSLKSLEKVTQNINIVIHAAGMNAQDCEKNLEMAFKVNGVATSNLLKAAIKQKVKRFIYLSTAHVYGNLTGTITEKTPIKATHPYATSHQAGEDVVLSANKIGDIEGVVIRLSNAFGALVDSSVNCWMLLVNDLCRQAVSTDKLILSSSGKQRRNFISLTDAW